MNNKNISDLYEKEFSNLTWKLCFEKLNNLQQVIKIPTHHNPNVKDSMDRIKDIATIRSKILKRLRKEQYINNIEDVKEYAMTLLLFTMLENEEEFCQSISILQSISEIHFPDDIELAEIYASGLMFLLKKQQYSRQKNTIKLLQNLSEVRFANNSKIKQLYIEGLEYIENIKKDQSENSEDLFLLDSHKWEELLPKMESILKEISVSEFYDDENAIQIFELLQVLYADSELSVSTDETFESVFYEICEFYNALDINKKNITFVPIQSNEGKIYTLHEENSDVYAIVWDYEYWDFFKYFCCLLIDIIKYEQGNLLNMTIDTLIERDYKSTIMETLLWKTYRFMSNRYCTANPKLSQYFNKMSDRYREKGIIGYNELYGNGYALVYLGKLYAMLHEMEHIFWELDFKNSSVDFDTFMSLLLIHMRSIKSNDIEKIHDYSKQEYIKKFQELLKGTNEWGDLRIELFYDFKAFCEMLVFQEHFSEKTMTSRIKDSIISAKVFNMFRTYLFVVSYFIDTSLKYKEKGLKGEQCIQKVYDEFHQTADEVEFRQVLNHCIELLYLCVCENNNTISEIEYRQIESCADSYIDAYQKYILEVTKFIQIEFLTQFINKD